MAKEMNDEAAAEAPKTRLYRWTRPRVLLRIGFVVLLLLLLVYLTIDFARQGPLKRGMTAFVEAARSWGAGGAFLLMFLYILGTCLMLPGLLLTLATGFLCTQILHGNQALGTCLATVIVLTGATTGATLALVMARYCLRDAVERSANKYKIFRAVDKSIAAHGMKVCFLLRLSPLIPFNVLNYALGITSVRLASSVAACLGMLPGTLAYCFVGSTISSLSEADSATSQGGNKTLIIVLTVCGAIASVVVAAFITFLARRELQKMLAEEAEEQMTEAYALDDVGGGGERRSSDDDDGKEEEGEVVRHQEHTEAEGDRSTSGEKERDSHSQEV